MVAAQKQEHYREEDETSSPSYSELASKLQKLWDLLEQVKDPEIPVISIRELGVLRGLTLLNSRLIVTITPTYSACPAMDVIREDIAAVLTNSAYPDFEIKTILSPAWTTDWLGEEAKQKLEEFGIAAPAKLKSAKQTVYCSRCKSESTQLISQYGSTACKAMYRCKSCEETFCYFKAI